jgi:PAS domain S-box-containing protein
MSFLDIRTVLFSHIVTDALCTAVMAFLWVQNRRRFPGIILLVVDFACQTGAVLLIVLRGSIPDWVSMTASNTLVVMGAVFGFVGLSRFIGKKSRQFQNIILLAIFVVVHLYFEMVHPNLAARNLNVSLALIAVCAQCLWLSIGRAEGEMRHITGLVGLVFGLFCLVSLVRIAVILSGPLPNNDLFRSGAYDALVLMAYQILLILLTFALTLMVNRRLLLEIRGQEEKFGAAFRSSPYAITLSQPSDGRIIEVNDGFVRITGHSAAEAVGKTVPELRLWARDEDRDAVLGALSRGERLSELECQFRTKSGELITGSLSAELIHFGDKAVIQSSIADITDRRRGEEALRVQTELFAAELERRVAERTAQLEEANQELEVFAYSVSHDLRSPLRALDGFSSILLEDHGAALDAEGRRVCAVIREGAGEMGRLIDDLLEFSRLGNAGMRTVEVDMEGMARQAFDESAGPDDRARIDLRVGPMPIAHGDPALLRIVWDKLLSNAVKFSSKKARAHIEVGGEDHGGESVYFVRDDGAGFDMLYAGKLFGVFQRLHGAKEFEGRGGGLAAVRRIVGRHGGRVWAEGKPGEGATFSFSLPAGGGCGSMLA